MSVPVDALTVPARTRTRIAARSWIVNRVPEPAPERAEGVDPVRSERMKRAWETRRRRAG